MCEINSLIFSEMLQATFFMVVVKNSTMHSAKSASKLTFAPMLLELTGLKNKTFLIFQRTCSFLQFQVLHAFSTYVKKWKDIKPLDRTLVAGGSCTMDMLPQYFMCASGMKDHRACCRRGFVPNDCLVFCNPNEADWPRDMFYLHKRCHIYVNTMFECMWQRAVSYRGRHHRINYE